MQIAQKLSLNSNYLKTDKLQNEIQPGNLNFIRLFLLENERHNIYRYTITLVEHIEQEYSLEFKSFQIPEY